MHLRENGVRVYELSKDLKKKFTWICDLGGEYVDGFFEICGILLFCELSSGFG